MFWADKLVKQIPNKNKKHRVDDMKTVSGMPHVGSLRAVMTHDVVYKAMRDAGFKVDFTYVFNDMDPMDGLPIYLDRKEYAQHMGKPLYKIPSPQKGYKSFAEYYATKYKQAFNKVGCHPKIIWSHEFYAAGKFDAVVRTLLDKAAKVRQIYKQVAGQDKPKNWHPYQVVCEKCGKVGTTIVTAWDSKKVTYECRPNLVTWAKGCGYKGKIEPVGENGKLMWKPDWPAHWKIVGVTVEGAGKEHFTEGGSRDIGVNICKKVLKTQPPFGFMHEFFLVGGAKMSSSKGSGIGADKITEIIPPYLVRFLVVKTPLRRAVDFDPNGNTIPDLFDEYDKTAQAYWDPQDNYDKDLARIFELSQVDEERPRKHFLPRFREVAKVIQDPKINIEKHFAKIKGKTLTQLEKNTLKERIKYAKIWLDNYAAKEEVFSITNKLPEQVKDLDKSQRDFLKEVVKFLEGEEQPSEELQQKLYEKSKQMGLSAKKAFGAIYLALLGKNYGPKAAWLLNQNKTLIIQRLKKVIGD